MNLILQRSLAIGALLAGLLVNGDAWAQSGMFGGGRSVGSGTITAGGRSAFGGSGGAGGGTPGTGLSQLGTTGQITGSERFVRDNRSANQFVGADSADTSFVGALQGGTTGAGGLGTGGFGSGGLGAGGFGSGGLGAGGLGSGGLGGGGFGAGGLGRGTAGGGRAMTGRAGMMGQRGMAAGNRQVQVRAKLEIGFEHTPLTVNAVQSNLETRLNQLSLKRLTPLEVQTIGRTVTLRGTLASESQRALAVAIAKLEPGVETVVDQLTVAAPDSQSPGSSQP